MCLFYDIAKYRVNYVTRQSFGYGDRTAKIDLNILCCL